MIVTLPSNQPAAKRKHRDVRWPTGLLPIGSPTPGHQHDACVAVWAPRSPWLVSLYFVSWLYLGRFVIVAGSRVRLLVRHSVHTALRRAVKDSALVSGPFARRQTKLLQFRVQVCVGGQLAAGDMRV